MVENYRSNLKSAELIHDTDKIKIYNLGQTPSFHLRAKKSLTVDEYDQTIGHIFYKWEDGFGYKYNFKLGLVLFPLGEGTEVTGLITSLEGLESLKALLPYFDISIGLASEEGPSYLEYDENNDFVNLGCFSKVAAARGINEVKSKGDITVWQLASSVLEQSPVIIGYKNTKLIERNLEDVEKILSNSSIDIPPYLNGIDMRSVRFLAHDIVHDVRVIKIDINDFTRTILSSSPQDRKSTRLNSSHRL